DKRGVESLGVFTQHFRRVALWVDRNEKHLQVFALFTEQRFDLRGVHERGGADIRALCKPEEHQHNLALEIFQAAHVAVRDLPFEAITERGASEIDTMDVLQARFGFSTSGEGKGEQGGAQRADKRPAIDEVS